MAEINIEYLVCDDGSDDAVVLCRGHVDPEAFCRAVKEQEGISLKPAQVRYTYMRFVPDGPGSRDMRAWECGPGRGAFPVTVAEVG